MESTDSSGGPPPHPNLPPGFRFHPTDEELVVHYLKRKAASAPLPVAIIAEVDLYKFDPWELPAKAAFGDHEWYFFSPRDRKYPNGARPNRAATSGYWKATGTDKPVLAAGSQKVGVKKALVFYGGKPPKGVKTNWIMHEYRLSDNKASNRPPGCDFGNKKNSLRLDDWVLCRIYKKSNTGRHMDNDKDEMMDDIFGGNLPTAISMASSGPYHQNISRMSIFPAKNSSNYGIFSDNDASLYDGGVMNNISSSDNNNNMGLNLASSSGSKTAELPMMMSSLKRALPAPYWPATDAEEATAAGEGSPSKRFHGDISSLLAQTAPPPLVQQPAAMLGDGMFRTSSYQMTGLNWYS